MYEHHGAWYVRYRQRILQEDGSAKLNHASKHLGRSADFSNIFEVKRCRASFMQAVNRDRFSAHSRITLTAFVEGAYLPWTKEERRASTSTGHHEIWIRFSRSSISSRFSQKPWLRSRPSRGYAKVSCADSTGPITRVANWRSIVPFGCRWSTFPRRGPAGIPCR